MIPCPSITGVYTLILPAILGGANPMQVENELSQGLPEAIVQP
jgi:hypothetical protein